MYRIYGDSLSLMPKLPREKFDLVVADPPYAKPAKVYEVRRNFRKWLPDTSILSGWWISVVDMLVPLMRENSTIVTFANANAIAIFLPVLYESFANLNVAVWDKERIGMGRPLRMQTEFILYASRGKPYVENNSHPNIFRCCPVANSEKLHPAQKPVPLMEEIVSLFCPRGGWVLDPFAGSFSTEKACRKLKEIECVSDSIFKKNGGK